MSRLVDIAVGTMRATYERADAEMAKRLALHKKEISCKRGCCSCCHIMAVISLAEGIILADKVLRMPKAERLRVTRALRRSAPPLGMTADEYALLGIPCAFLDVETKDCTVYEDRPAVCRYHFVESPPEDCKPGVPRRVAILDTLDYEEEAHSASAKLTGQLIGAPIPYMVLHGMASLDPTKRKGAKGMATPMQWLARAKEADKEAIKQLSLQLPEERYRLAL